MKNKITKTFRFFVSSTFKDFSEERRLLQQYVFPQVKDYASSKGFIFQPIDLRWGVSNEAQLDQKALALCIEEVKASKDNPHPNFLIMAGDRYGWIPTPYAIEKEEFEKIYEYLKSNNDNINIEYSLSCKKRDTFELALRKTTKLGLIEQWYKLDDNQVPTSYILQERTTKDINGINDYTVYETWESEEKHLRDILQNAAAQIFINKNDKEYKKYFTSATEHEVINGILRYLYTTPHQEILKAKDNSYETNDYQHVFGYIRKIKNCIDDLSDINLEKSENFKLLLKDTIKIDNLLEAEVSLSNLYYDNNNGSLHYR